jgi:hypothetical protein
MVKRTVVVLSILSLLVLAAGSSFAFVPMWPGDCAPAAPCFVPVDCCPYPLPTTIIKTWSCKIEGPCPAPGPVCGPADCGKTGFRGLLGLAGVIAGPCEVLFGGFDGVYGCFSGPFGKTGGPCGPCWGPVPAVLAGCPMVLAAPVMFGDLW